MFRFTIRDVLWLTVVVAMAVGWWQDWSRNRIVYSMSFETERTAIKLRPGDTLEIAVRPQGEISRRVLRAGRKSPVPAAAGRATEPNP
jgi:hypothetical protein